MSPLPPHTACVRTRLHCISPIDSLAQVSLIQDARLGSVNVIAWQERVNDGTVALLAAEPHLLATAQTKATGKRACGLRRACASSRARAFTCSRAV